MSARGVTFLEVWIDDNVAAKPGGVEEAQKLAQKLAIDALAAGFTLADMELDFGEPERYILDAMARLAELGTQGD